MALWDSRAAAFDRLRAGTYALSVRTIGRLGCVLAGLISLSACSSSSDDAATSSTGAAGEDGGGAGEAGAAGSADGGRRGVSLAEVAHWPMPNAPHEGLPNSEQYDASSTPGVVHDLVTGLDWRQNPGSTLYSLADAADECAALSLAGKKDWRLPTFIELVSLFDAVPNDADPPLYLASVFEARDRFWCSTPTTTASAGLGRMLDFTADTCGTKACSIGVSGKQADAIAGAFCVRSSAALPTERFNVGIDGVSDTLTGLNWITLPSAIQTGTHAEAISRCAALGDGARLPSINELLTLFVPLLDGSAFPDWPNSLFGWSSSAIPAKPGSFWAAASGGATQSAATTAIHRIECVR